MCLTGDRRFQFWCVFVEPVLNLVIKRDQLARGGIADKGRDPGRGPVNIDLVCQIHAITKRQFIQEQKLGCFLIRLWNAVKGWVIAIHVHVEPLDRVAERADVADFGLRAKEGRQIFELGQIRDRIDAVLLACIDRIFEDVQATKLGLVKIGSLASLKALVKIAQEIIFELDLRDACRKADDDHRDTKKQALLVTDHEFTKCDHKPVNRGRALVLPDRHPADQARKKEHRENPDADHATGNHVAKLAEGW